MLFKVLFNRVLMPVLLGILGIEQICDPLSTHVDGLILEAISKRSLYLLSEEDRDKFTPSFSRRAHPKPS